MLNLRLPLPRLLTAGDTLFGKGAIGALRAMGAARAALLVGPFIPEDERLFKTLKRSIGAIETRVFVVPDGEPALGALQDLFGEVAAFGPDWIIAVGGGAVLDAAKLAWVFYEHPDADLERIVRPGGLGAMRGKARFAAVPTTAGTGSETSSAALFLDEATGRKRYVASHELLPDVAILDPAFSLSCPAGTTAMSGVDALAHVVEGAVSRLANPFLQMLAEQTLKTIFDELPRCVEEPGRIESRMSMLSCAHVGGWLQNLSLPGLAHAVGHQLGSFHVPHGLACGALLPASIRINSEADAANATYSRLAAALGLGGPDALADACEELMGKIGLGISLDAAAEGGPTAVRDASERIVAGAMADICARTNPRPVEPDMVLAALETVFS